MYRLPLLLFFLLISAVPVAAQQSEGADRSDHKPKIAFLKSVAIPGWGHYYLGGSDWERGKYHLAAEALLVLGYAGLSIHFNYIRQNWYAYGREEAGVVIKGRSRQFQIAVGNFNSLEAYNDYQKRSRNWDMLIADQPENRWQWSGSTEREKYNDLRNRFGHIDRQLPALIGMMVVNRIISGISAYNRAVKRGKASEAAGTVFLSRSPTGRGLAANVKIEF